MFYSQAFLLCFFLRSFQRKLDRWASNILCSSAQTWVLLPLSPPQVCSHLNSPSNHESVCYQSVETLHPFLLFHLCLSPFGPVEFVKAADIKVIAALGDSLTVCAICFVGVFFLAVIEISDKDIPVWLLICNLCKSQWLVMMLQWSQCNTRITSWKQTIRIVLVFLWCCVFSFQTAIGANATTVLGIPIEFRHVSWRWQKSYVWNLICLPL